MIHITPVLGAIETMEQPTLSDTVEVEIDTNEVLLNFEKNLDADQFREWWEQAGWSHFQEWLKTQEG